MSEARRAYFRAHPLLEGLSEAPLERIAKRSEPVRLRRRTALWAQDTAPRAVWWIRSGVVRVGCSPDCGHEVTLAFHGRGALLGEAAGLSDDPRATHAEAHEDCTLFATPATEIELLLDREPAFARRFAELLHERRRRLESRVAQIVSRSARARLASVLLELSRDFGVRDSRGTIVNLRLTHREVAALLGTTRETASLALVELRRAELLVVDGKRLVLLDADGLGRVARGAASVPDRRAAGS